MPFPRPASSPLDVCEACGHVRACHGLRRAFAHGADRHGESDEQLARRVLDVECDACGNYTPGVVVCERFDGKHRPGKRPRQPGDRQPGGR